MTGEGSGTATPADGDTGGGDAADAGEAAADSVDAAADSEDGAAVSQADAAAVDLTDLDTTAHPVVLFDGVCNLCTGWVRFIVPRDGDGTLRFAPLQSDVGAALLERCGSEATDRESIVLVEDGECYRKSTAVLRIAAHLDSPWQFARHLRSVPRPLRDVTYDLVARYRYDVFGRTEQCMVPDEDIRDRFLAMTDQEGRTLNGVAGSPANRSPTD